MRTFLFILSAGFFIAALITWANRFLDNEENIRRKQEILDNIRKGIPFPYNKQDIRELEEAGLIEWKGNKFVTKY